MRRPWLIAVLVTVVLGSGAGSSGAEVGAVGSSCPPAWLLASRGSGDQQSKDEGIGRPELALQSKLGDLIPGLQTWANPYPAVGVFSWDWHQLVNGAGALTKLSGLGLGAYHDSVVTGTNLLATKLHAVTSACGAKTAIILAGYSQGAQVTADVFQRDLNSSERAKVAAVVLFGDPYFNGGDRIVDRGSFSGRRDGLLGKRPEFGSTGNTLVLSYCHSHDPICQGFFFRVAFTRTLDPGALTQLQHKNYTKFGEPQQAAELISKLARLAPSSGGRSSGPIITTYHLRAGAFPRLMTFSGDGSLWITESGDDSGPVGYGVLARRSPTGGLSEYRILSSSSTSGNVITGPDGAIWFCGLEIVGRIDPATGALTGWQTPQRQDLGLPTAITAGPDGAIWYTNTSVPAGINRLTTSGLITKFDVPSGSGGLEMPGIATGPDGALWFTQSSVGNGPPDSIGRMTINGHYSRWSLPTQHSLPTRITTGPDGAVWFTERAGYRIGRITTAGKITEFGLPHLAPFDITVGKDGALWFTTDTRVGRITTSGKITTWLVPGAKALIGIVAAPDGSFWLTDGQADVLRHFIPPS